MTSAASAPATRHGEQSDPPRQPDRPARDGPTWLPELLWILATALVAIVVAVIDLELWRMSARVPLFGADGDAGFFLAAVKGVVEHGWFFRNPDLGAPFGQENFDFASSFGDVAHYGIVKVLGLLFGDAVVVFNAFFLLCFPVIAVVAYGVLRDLGAMRAVALVVGVLYAFAPYHLFRNQQHLFLSAYYVVPLAVWLVVSLVEGRVLIQRRLSRRTLKTVGVCLLVGAASAYYAIFALLALVVVVSLAALARRSRSMALQGLVVVSIVTGSFVLCHAPAIVNTIVQGPNESAGKRPPAESERFGLKLTHMVLPRPEHRVGFLARRGAIYKRQAPRATASEGFSPSLGVVATIGLAGAMVVLLITGLGSREASVRRRRVSAAGAAALVCFVVGTTGGVSALVAFELTAQVRAWNRVSIVISFAALLVVALALTALAERWRAHGRKPWAFGAVLAAVGVLGLLDQTSPKDAPDYPVIAAKWRETGDFVRGMEARLPAGTKVLQLPYMAYPENGGIHGMVDYDHLKGYLHSTRLTWSYGAMKGRPTDWQDNAPPLGIAGVATAAMAAGFGAVEVDHAGYLDKGVAATAELVGLVGPERTASSASGRLQVFDMRDAAARLAAKTPPAARREISDALLHPVRFDHESGFSYNEAEGVVPFRWASAEAVLRVYNTLDKPRRVRFTADLFGAAVQASKVTVTLPGGRTETFEVSAAGLSYGVDFVVPPGGAVLRLRTEGPAAPAIRDNVVDRRLRVKGPRVREDAVADARLTQLAAMARSR